MISSILDTDLYKFSTSYAYFSLYPLAEGEFKFTDREKYDWGFDKDMFMAKFNSHMTCASALSLTNEEMEWCKKNIPYIPGTYWEWLSTFRFEKEKVNVWFDEDGVFNCTVRDKLYKVTFYEILILATYSEIRNEIMTTVPFNDRPFILPQTLEKLKSKIAFANENSINFSEFGTRRRFSSQVHEHVVDYIHLKSNTCTGTSNVFYAKRFNMKPIGTFPHEWVMFHGACFGYKRANYLSLEDWIKVYRGDLGIALVDTYTTKSFLRTLTKQQALLLSGFRQDSGDEFEVGEMIISRLKEFGIDPTTKTIVFSNALDFEKADKINNYFKDKCKVSFGIGTNLTCDIEPIKIKPCNIVMKLSRCRLSPKDEWENCIKISDDAGKHMGDDKEFEIAKHELKID